MATQSSAVHEPDFISFLLSSNLKPDCIFLVGNEDYMIPERIGVLKGMLMAHSVVLRLELEDSELAEKGEVAVPDIYPDTFRNLLRYVYGQDTTAALCFDEADNLLYVAEKYMMGTLKKKLATRLMSLLNPENICSLLNNPACYRELELNSAITEILRYETDKVLASPLFLYLCPDGFVKILEQDGLNVPEIELWRAMMKWAKHNANSEDGNVLRDQVSMLTEHIRICSLDAWQICQEVATTGVLTDNELALVCKSVGQQEEQSGLAEFCSEIEPRVLLEKKPNLSDSDWKQFELDLFEHTLCWSLEQEFNFKVIVTEMCPIELLPLEFISMPLRSPYDMITCTTEIIRITDYQNNTSAEAPIIVSFKKRVPSETRVMMPLVSEGCNIILLPNNRYQFKVVFGGNRICYWDTSRRKPKYHNCHLSLTIDSSNGHNYLPMNSFKYMASHD